MFLMRLRIVALLLVVAVVTGYGSQSSTPNRPWPPGLQSVNEDLSPALPPEAEARTFFMSSVYIVGIVALIWAPETKGRPLPED